MTEQNLYRQTMERLNRLRVNARDEKAVVLFLAEEIKYYRGKIKQMEQCLKYRVMYECDRRKCDQCNADKDYCGYMSDIRHAKNFELQHNAFVETSPPIK